MGDVVLNLRNLNLSFHGNKVLEDINLEVKKGEVVTLIGPSGTGKTSLLRCINLLENELPPVK